MRLTATTVYGYNSIISDNLFWAEPKTLPSEINQLFADIRGLLNDEDLFDNKIAIKFESIDGGVIYIGFKDGYYVMGLSLLKAGKAYKLENPISASIDLRKYFNIKNG